MAVKRTSPIQQYKQEVEKEIEIKEEPVVIEQPEPVQKKKAANKSYCPNCKTDDASAIIQHLESLMHEGDLIYNISGDHANAKRVIVEVAKYMKSIDFDISLITTPDGYQLKIKRAK